MNHSDLLSVLIFLPLLAAALLIPLGSRPSAVRAVALAAVLAELALAAYLWALPLPALPGAPPEFFLFQNLPWIERFGMRYTVGMDGISLLMTLLTTFITLIAVLLSWRVVQERVALFYFLLLATETGVLGVFLALDLFLFYLFWEAMLIPMLFLIGIWGVGRPIYSALKFFLYTFFGSLLMLVALITLYLLHGAETGVYTFALGALARTTVPYSLSLWLYGAFLLAFAIKFPLFPLHTWLPDAYSDAPTAGTVLLASLLAKTGAYALIRIGYPLFPEAARSCTPLVAALAVIGIIYCSWIAFAQKDMKRLVAYSSIGHVGFVGLGIAAWTPVALSGSLMQMVNHGVTTGALFAVVGMLDERAGSRETAGYGGLWGKVPVLAFFFLLFSMASAGVPGLNNFVGEFLVLAGSLRVFPLAAGIAFLGMVVTLIYTIRLVQDLLFGEARQPLSLRDLDLREGVLLGALAVAVVYLGVHPAPFLDLIKAPVAFLTTLR